MPSRVQQSRIEIYWDISELYLNPDIGQIISEWRPLQNRQNKTFVTKSRRRRQKLHHVYFTANISEPKLSPGTETIASESSKSSSNSETSVAVVVIKFCPKKISDRLFSVEAGV